MRLNDKVSYKDNDFWIMLLLIVIVMSFIYTLNNIQKRINVLSDKVKVLEYAIKQEENHHIYTSSIKETI